MPKGYFSNLLTIDYPYKGKIVSQEGQSTYVDTVACTDFMLRFMIRDEILRSPTAFYKWNWRSGDRPDTIAEKYYGDADYAWVVLLSAQLFDEGFDFPLSDTELINNAIETYKVVPINPLSLSGDFYPGERVVQYSGSEITFEGRLINISNSENALVLYAHTGQLVTGSLIEGFDSAATATTVATPSQDFSRTSLISTPHHFERISDGMVVDKSVYLTLGSDGKEVSILDYEIERNERNRQIKLLSNDLVSKLLQDLRKQVASVSRARSNRKIPLILGGRNA